MGIVVDDYSYPQDDEANEPTTDGRRPRAYVRFECVHESQSGPMYGPFDGLELYNDQLVGVRRSGRNQQIAERMLDGTWQLIENKWERSYKGFVVLFS